jgi:hypothetical protein
MCLLKILLNFVNLGEVIMNKFIVIGIMIASVMLAGCDMRPNSTQIERGKQEQLSLQAVQSVGMPGMVNFAEKRMMKEILELRDQNIVTYTYIVDMNNNLRKLCDSIGFGLPYATQYTNPQTEQYTGISGHYSVLPQSDPNGLYSPASADGTWVLCLNPETKKPVPLYVEPHVIVSPFPLK